MEYFHIVFLVKSSQYPEVIAIIITFIAISFFKLKIERPRAVEDRPGLPRAEPCSVDTQTLLSTAPVHVCSPSFQDKQGCLPKSLHSKCSSTLWLPDRLSPSVPSYQMTGN